MSPSVLATLAWLRPDDALKWALALIVAVPGAIAVTEPVPTWTTWWRGPVAKLRSRPWPPPAPPSVTHSISGCRSTPSSRAGRPSPTYAAVIVVSPAGTGPEVGRCPTSR
jgi:hypothetical protein